MKLNLPDPSRLINGLRDTGYNLNSAAADIVDNSIAAGAASINIRFDLHRNGAKYVYFGDDGHGMDADGVFSAMRYGADKRENLKSLGKFGLGLKTASSSNCKRYSLISRQDSNMPLSKVTWDLDHVEEVNQWEVDDQEEVTPDELRAFDELCGDKGTLLVWSKCDRILPSNDYEPGSSQEKAALKRLSERMADHFALVYHKYLDAGSDEWSTIKITINGEPVEPWNPFYPEKSEQVLAADKQFVEVALPDDPEVTYPFGIKAYVLPSSKDLTKEENNIARITNNRQGFYVYREGRLIESGGWQGIWNASEPHSSLIRVELTFNHELDDAFEVDVRKSRIIMNEALRDYLEKLLGNPRKHAQDVYRRKLKSSLPNEISHKGSNKTVADTRSVRRPTVSTSDPLKNETTVSNNLGHGIRIKAPVLNEQDPLALSIQTAEDVDSGNLWEPSFVSASDSDHQVGVRINTKHDFYSKIYAKAGSANSIEGMDLLLYALAAAEANNTDVELEAIWEDIRDEISSNLRKLLRNYELPTELS
ncbi:ATP-binding protein [Akkermansiaceae bacterium]|nr:ATP-binding protein [Akkermansiaceae bacterium]